MKYTLSLLLLLMTTWGWGQSDTNFFDFKEGVYLNLYHYNSQNPLFVEDLSSLNFIQENKVDLEALILSQQNTLNELMRKIDSLQAPLQRIQDLEKQVAALQAAVTLINQTQNLNAVVSSEDVVYLPTTTFDVPHDVKIHFALQTFSINAESLMMLNEVIDILTRNPKWKIIIQGFASEKSDTQSNLELARERSLEVQRMLLSAGVNPQQLALHFPEINDPHDGQKVVIQFVQL